MTCSLYYDLFTRDYSNVWLFILFCFFSFVRIALCIVGGIIFENRPLLRFNFRAGGIGVALTAAVLGIYIPYKRNADYDRLFALHSSGQESAVVGTVTNFSPLGPRPHSRHKETFDVNNVTFAYPPDDSELMLGFKQLRSVGGPLHENVLVRISYIEDSIVRLEICNSVGD
jgi:hypothetical protein